ncbi:TonB-dependent receptor plug domain-containing protein [Caulobacter mirabilis]|uniref:TonB-dependent receptor n=1 Tax=Caulobacter mirabilis TaxID=69666 RepID=A0A2D2AZZ0_9CAUL|nr:TonB-dependent receptor [Caulobacter mirabilis]ATQ43572.1 TonB-dependent receptor [Caulobacter mirabilis]
MIRALMSSTAVAAVLIAAPAFAEEAPTAPTPDVAGATAVDTLVVTATRSPTEASKVATIVTVLDKKAIDAAQSSAVIDILATSAGVSFTSNGGPGTSTTLNIRGAEGQHAVVLIDGVKLNDPSSTQGGYNFGSLLVGDISRIEVLRGAQSTLWGSQAIGGVVNVVTAEATQPFQGNLDVEGGSRGTGYLRAGVGGKTERLDWRLAGGYYTTDGFSSYKRGAEEDGYRNTGLAGRARLKITDAVSAEVRAVYSDGEYDFDGFGVDSPEYGKTKELVVYTGLNFDLLDGRWKNRLAFAYTDTDRRNFDPRQASPTTFDADGQNKRWEYQGVFAITEAWNATFGAETEDAEMTTWSSFAPVTRRGKAGVDSVYVQLQGEVIPGLTLTGGVRRDSHDTYGDHTLGQLGAAWALNEGRTILRASFGQGFRAPGLYELYSEYGNLNLDPEEFDSWEAGVEQKLLGDAVTVSATYFKRKADNEIRFESCFGSTDPLCTVGGVPRSGFYKNTQKTETQGVELIGKARLGDQLSLSANYTWTDAQNASGPNNGKQLTRRPEHMGNLSATWAWTPDVSTTASLRYVGETFDNATNTVKVDAYSVVDLRASWQVNDTVELYGRVENLFDEDYQRVRNYGTPGRGAFVGLRARF